MIMFNRIPYNPWVVAWLAVSPLFGEEGQIQSTAFLVSGQRLYFNKLFIPTAEETIYQQQREGKQK